MVQTSDGLDVPNPMERRRIGVPPEHIKNTSTMSPSEREAFLAERLKEARRTSNVSDEEYAERLRRAGLEPE